jgi:hypothetical protein
MGWVVNATPRPLYPRERTGTHCIGGWFGRTSKNSPQKGFDSRSVQPVASRYTIIFKLYGSKLNNSLLKIEMYLSSYSNQLLYKLSASA